MLKVSMLKGSSYLLCFVLFGVVLQGHRSLRVCGVPQSVTLFSLSWKRNSILPRLMPLWNLHLVLFSSNRAPRKSSRVARRACGTGSDSGTSPRSDMARPTRSSGPTDTHSRTWSSEDYCQKHCFQTTSASALVVILVFRFTRSCACHFFGLFGS